MRLSLFFLAAALTSPVLAAPITRDLGQGLVFYRVHEVPADLPAGAPTRKQPCVLDLRYTKAGDKAANTLDTWLKAWISPTAPLLILANGATDRELRSVLNQFEPEQGVMLIGVPARDFRPDLSVQSSAENERQAYDALEKGTALPALLSDNPDKIRNDEATLAKDRVPEIPVRDETAPQSAADPGAAPASAESKIAARPPVDAALQRAVHMHRALVALKKI